MTTPETSRAIPELSVDAQVLEKHLLTLEVDQVATYVDLSALIKRDVQHESRGVMATAQKRILRNHNRVFACVIGVGIKRLDDSAIVGIGDSFIRKQRRAAKRTARQLSCADPDKLNAEDRAKLDARLSFTGAMLLFTKDKPLRALEAQCASNNSKLPTAETMALFSK
tara:strand:- start:7169 stop:7672 length:504 start_codon:yes stop_codon:yes gene_type:complete